MKLKNNLTLDNILASIESSYKKKFSKNQIKELVDGYHDGVNILAYADPRISDLIMYQIHLALLDFGNPDDCNEFRRRIGRMRLDEWAKHVIYEEAPYHVNDKGEPIDEIDK